MLLKSWAHAPIPDVIWLLILGAIFIVVTVFMPKGLVGLPDQLRQAQQRRRKARAAVASALAAKSQLVETK